MVVLLHPTLSGFASTRLFSLFWSVLRYPWRHLPSLLFRHSLHLFLYLPLPVIFLSGPLYLPLPPFLRLSLSFFSLFSSVRPPHSLTLIVFLLIHRPLSFHHLSPSYSLFRTSAFVIPSIYPFLSLFNLSSSVVLLYLLGYLLSLSLQRPYTGWVSRSARIACVLVCDTLATTELSQTRRHSVHTRWTSCTKSCVNGVACAGILESFVVDVISFKVVTEGGVNSLEKITSGSLLILSRFKYRTMGFNYGRMNYYRDSLVYCLYNNWFHRWAFLLLFIFHLKRTPIL